MRFTLFIWLLVVANHHSAQDWSPLDNGLGCPFNGEVKHMIVDSMTGDLIVSGAFQTDGNCDTMRAFARWNGVSWNSIGNTHGGASITVYEFRDTLYGTGYLLDEPPLDYHDLHRYNLNDWDSIPEGPDGSVQCFTENNGVLYFGGSFDKCGNDSTYLLGRYENGVCSGLVPNYKPSGGTSISDLIFYQNELYAGGNFNCFSVQGFSNFGKVSNGDFVSVDAQFNNTGGGLVSELIVYNGELIIAGGFNKSSGYTGDYIMKWDGNTMSELGTGVNDRVNDLEVFNGELYALGWFTEAGGNSAYHIAKWDGLEWTAVNTNPISEWWKLTNMIIWNDDLYIAGTFSEIDGVTLNGIARFNQSLNIHNPENSKDLKLYPNPTSDIINYSYPGTTDNLDVQIFNLLGQCVHAEKSIPTAGSINILSLPKGCYKVIFKTASTHFDSFFIKI